MKEIRDSKKTREVTPKDFEFLSDADKEVALGVEKMLRTIFGWDNTMPIILNGLEYDSTNKKITAGKVLYNGVVYDVGKLSLQSSISFNNASTLLTNVKLLFTSKVVSPSPVYDESLQQSINVHYERYGVLMQVKSTTHTTLGGSVTVTNNNGFNDINVSGFSFLDLYRVENISGQITSLNERVTALEKAVSLKNITLSSGSTTL
ncbi:MAG: hypothetical protein ACTTJH_00640 [Bacteroidales bacterium]